MGKISGLNIAVIVSGIAITIGAWRCAHLERRMCQRLPRECHALGPVLFDIYRALMMSGLTSIVVGLTNQVLPLTTVGVASHVGSVGVPIGISWSLKVGAVYFLWLRLRWYHARDDHGWS